MEPRSPYQRIWEALVAEKSMVFLAGPRQSGKTTLGRIIAGNVSNHLYFCWDIHPDRRKLLGDPLFFTAVERRDASTPLVLFDEIHKYSDWKNYLKGVYDQFHDEYRFLVTGSGRLDVHQRGGDSLAGRYFLFHLWPFTISELGGRSRELDDFLADPLEVTAEDAPELRRTWEDLSELSGFPEPYLSGRKTTWRRWSNSYGRQIVREDVRDLTGVRAIGDLENLFLLLPSRVGSPLSIPSLSRDLKVAYNTLRNWLEILERFFLGFTIGPFRHRVARTIQKERKVYLWDAPSIVDPGARFENLVALELMRAVTSWTDLGHGNFSLHFVKNKDQQEVDFLVAESNRPLFLVETKLSNPDPSPALRKFQVALDVPAVQLHAGEGGHRLVSNANRRILVAPAHRWLPTLP